MLRSVSPSRENEMKIEKLRTATAPDRIPDILGSPLGPYAPPPLHNWHVIAWLAQRLKEITNDHTAVASGQI
jgi:hypothetical protein